TKGTGGHRKRIGFCYTAPKHQPSVQRELAIEMASRFRWELLAWLTLTALAYSQPPAQSGPRPQASSSVPADQGYRIIQVRKGVASDQLIPAMQFITASLGVECRFCHVENHFDQDDKKPKQTARKMMQMMMAINQNHFDNHLEVTCNSCHHG